MDPIDSVDPQGAGPAIIKGASFTRLNKGIIFDRKRVIVTSTNWSQQSAAFNREAGVLIESNQIAEFFAEVFDFDWVAAKDPDDIARDQQELATRVALGQARYEEVDPADRV